MGSILRIYLLLSGILFLSEEAFSQPIQGTYAIKNIQTGMLLRIKDANKNNGTPLVAYEPVNWKCMTWDFDHVDGRTYQLKNLFTGKTFQATNAIISEAVALEQQPLLPGEPGQQYEFIPVGKNYLIRLKDTDLYITPTDSKGTMNSGVILAKNNGTPLQQWAIYEQHPTM